MAHDKDKHHRATKKVYKKGSNPLDPHEHYHGDQRHHTRIRGRTSISTTKGMSPVQTIRPAAENEGWRSRLNARCAGLALLGSGNQDAD